MTPDIVADTRWFKSPYVGVVNFKVLKIGCLYRKLTTYIGPNNRSLICLQLIKINITEVWLNESKPKYRNMVTMEWGSLSRSLKHIVARHTLKLLYEAKNDYEIYYYLCNLIFGVHLYLISW